VQVELVALAEFNSTVEASAAAAALDGCVLRVAQSTDAASVKAELASVPDASAEDDATREFSRRPFDQCLAGRRLDTLHIHKLPIRCFKAPGIKGPSAEQIAAVFGRTGGLTRFQVVQDAEGTLNFRLYIQFESSEACLRAFRALYGRKLVQPLKVITAPNLFCMRVRVRAHHFVVPTTR
jgi:hypothetical protein